MEFDLKNYTELNTALLGADFLEKTKLEKSEILMFIENEVLALMEMGENKLLNLLYSIDIPEKKFLELTTQTDFLAKISEQILYREAYKVWLRKQYS